MTELPPSPDRTGLEADAAEGFGSALCFGQEKALGAPRRQGPPRADPAPGPLPGPCPCEDRGHPSPTTPHNKLSLETASVPVVRHLLG